MLVPSVLLPEDKGVPGATLARPAVKASLGWGRAKPTSQKPSLCSSSVSGRPELGISQRQQVDLQPPALVSLLRWFRMW